MSGAMFPQRLPWWLSSKESARNAGDGGSIPGSRRSPGGGHGKPLQCSCLENPMKPTEATEHTHVPYTSSSAWPALRPPAPAHHLQLLFLCPFWLVVSSFSLHPPQLGPSLLQLCYTFPLVQSFEGLGAGFSVSPPHGPSSLTFCAVHSWATAGGAPAGPHTP